MTKQFRRAVALTIATVAFPIAIHAAQQAPENDTSLPPAWNSSGWHVPADSFDVQLEAATARMSDGTVLKADVMYPRDRKSQGRAAGPFPVLLEQTPYRWAFYPDLESVIRRGRYFVSRGYIYVLAHTRGTADSGGRYDFFGARESRDGVELASWASRIAGGNGDVGLVGCSATGINQFLTAAQLGPASPVRAIAAGGMGDDVFSEVIFPGGMYSTGGDWVYESVFSQLGTTSSIQASLDLLANLRAGGTNALRSPFWQGLAPGGTVEAVVRNRIPVLLYSGWQDVYLSPPYLMTMLQNAAAGRPVHGEFAGAPNPRYQVIMAPGGHCSGDDGGPRDQANFRWFETWMRGQKTGIATVEAPFHFHSLNSSEWRSFKHLPSGDQYRSFHITADGKLVTKGATHAAANVGQLYYGTKVGGSNDVSFTSEPLDESYYVTGGSALTLTLKTSAREALVVADLYDIAPDGSAKRITRGNLLGSMRTPMRQREWRRADGEVFRPSYDMSRASPVPSGEMFSLSVALQPRFALIEKGHRLRLRITPRSDVTTGECDEHLGGPYPCLIGTLPQQLSLLGSSYEIASNGTLAIAMLSAANLAGRR